MLSMYYIYFICVFYQGHLKNLSSGKYDHQLSPFDTIYFVYNSVDYFSWS